MKYIFLGLSLEYFGQLNLKLGLIDSGSGSDFTLVTTPAHDKKGLSQRLRLRNLDMKETYAIIERGT